MRIFKVKVMLDESKEQSRLIKDIEQEQYTLLMGKKDANKPVSSFMDIKDKVLKLIQAEYQTKDIDIKLI